MPITNPKRMLTTKGMKALLNSLDMVADDGPFKGAKCFAVVAAAVAPNGRELTSVTVGVEGLQTGANLVLLGEPLSSQWGKVYKISTIITNTVASPTGAQTVVGILIGSDTTIANALAYLELEEPVTIDEDGEAIRYSVEFGFNGQAFYVVPRVLADGV